MKNAFYILFLVSLIGCQGNSPKSGKNNKNTDVSNLQALEARCLSAGGEINPLSLNCDCKSGTFINASQPFCASKSQITFSCTDSERHGEKYCLASVRAGGESYIQEFMGSDDLEVRWSLLSEESLSQLNLVRELKDSSQNHIFVNSKNSIDDEIDWLDENSLSIDTIGVDFDIKRDFLPNKIPTNFYLRDQDVLSQINFVNYNNMDIRFERKLHKAMASGKISPEMKSVLSVSSEDLYNWLKVVDSEVHQSVSSDATEFRVQMDSSKLKLVQKDKKKGCQVRCVVERSYASNETSSFDGWSASVLSYFENGTLIKTEVVTEGLVPTRHGDVLRKAVWVLSPYGFLSHAVVEMAEERVVLSADGNVVYVESNKKEGK